MNVYDFFEQIFRILNQDDAQVIITAVYLSIALITIILRIVAYIHFHSELIVVRMDITKEIKKREDFLAKSKLAIKSAILRKTITEYMKVAERAVTNVPTSQLINRAISGMSLLGWRYDNILPLVESLENMLLFVGLILAIVFTNSSFAYATMAIIIFLVTRLSLAFFNARATREQLADEMYIFISREVGRFFASDTGGAILRLKNDLTEAINNQSETYTNTMKNIATTMEHTMDNVAQSMVNAANSIGPIVANAMDEKLINMNTTLTTTLKNWESALSEAGRIQTAMNESSEKLSQSSTRVQSASELLATHLKGHSNALSEQLIALINAMDLVKDSTNNLITQQDTLVKQIKYIESNQQTLDVSIHSYEATLQGLAQTLGEGIGTFIDLHAQTSAQAINDALKANTEKITAVLQQQLRMKINE